MGARGSTGRLLALPPVRRLGLACAALAAAVWAAAVVQWTLVAAVVVDVVSDRTAPDAGPLAGIVAAWLVRSGLVAARDLLAARTSARVRSQARADLARKLVRLGPYRLSGERSGELVTTATSGVTRLHAVVARLVPTAASAAVVSPRGGAPGGGGGGRGRPPPCWSWTR